jgi:hypothetical protein
LIDVRLGLANKYALKTVASCAVKCRDRLQKAEMLSTANLAGLTLKLRKSVQT